MSELSRFYGLIVRMFHNDHEPAHFHVVHGEHAAAFFLDGTYRDGEMPAPERRRIRRWARMHRAELEAAWDTIQQGGEPPKISGLR